MKREAFSLKKKMKHVSSVMLISLLAASVAACSNNGGGETSSSPQPGNETQPPKLTNLTYWVTNQPSAASQMKTYAEMEMYKELEKISGVNSSILRPMPNRQKNSST
jgi:putative aldouronate transport system substrate-binding protein